MRMKLAIRRIGNSLGIIIPKATLDAWGLEEGGHLELTEQLIRPVSQRLPAHQVLDEHKRRLAAAVASRCTAQQIRAQSLANLHRWKNSGVWLSAYSEWEQILRRGDDGELFAVLLGRDDRANRLRQSPPYVGLLPREEVRRLNEEAAA
jgi:antitoxin component of MazEF toxin-antitoxin module